MSLYSIVLPWPPALSAYFANAIGMRKHGAKAGSPFMSKRITPEGQAFRAEVLERVRKGHRQPPRLAGELSVLVLLRPPERKSNGALYRQRFDLDNRAKALFDALVAANVMIDDSQLYEIRMIRCLPEGRGVVEAHFKRFEPWNADIAGFGIGAGR